MDHALIEEDALLELYAQGRLDPEVEEELEAHLVGCATCQEELIAVRGLARGVRRVASEEAARLVVQAGIASRLRRTFSGPGRWGWIAAAALVVLGALAATYAARMASENRELRAIVAAQGPGEGAGDTEGTRTTPKAPQDFGERDRLAALEQTLPAAVGTVVLLTEVRGADDTPPAVDRATVGGPFALAVYVLDDPRFSSYRMEVVGEDGTIAWQRSGVTPNAFEALMATFAPEFFAAGEYELRIFGVPDEGGAEPLESYRFVVL